MNDQHEVHIVHDGKRFAVRVGLFRSVFGYNSALAAKLPGSERLHDHCKPGSPEAYQRGAALFVNLTKKNAEAVAAHMILWIASMNVDRRPERGAKKLATVTAKYEEAVKR